MLSKIDDWEELKTFLESRLNSDWNKFLYKIILDESFMEDLDTLNKYHVIEENL